ncbi:MAG: ATP-binding cassette domain-containing protein [Oscillospiraceae bacterium]|jgi:ABC-type lipoprotein export system ATPase subunit|nr:ATP-binding cassette domain-containing protein [Oscillospiraceae bacterium]
MMNVESLTVIGGHNKHGDAENIHLRLFAGTVTAVTGPTGSGKSRLLSDIECLAQFDTPTGRGILVNDAPADDRDRFGFDGKLVAQLSQNMNFVTDLTVGEFLAMHAESRRSEEDGLISAVFKCANNLAGEKFTLDTKVTQLSGGQSRALMIADCALMSNSPIVLIDEIENAGVDRRKAIALLTRSEKIVLVSTHDPLLALGADMRIVIKNGGIYRVMETSEEEKNALSEIEMIDALMSEVRGRIRRGERVEYELLRVIQRADTRYFA